MRIDSPGRSSSRSVDRVRWPIRLWTGAGGTSRTRRPVQIPLGATARRRRWASRCERSSRRASDAADLDDGGALPALAPPEEERHGDDADGDDRADGDAACWWPTGGLLDVALQLADLRLEVAAPDRAVEGLAVGRSQAWSLSLHDAPHRGAPTSSAAARTTMRYGTHERFPVKVRAGLRLERPQHRQEQQDRPEPEHQRRRRRRSRGSGRAP